MDTTSTRTHPLWWAATMRYLACREVRLERSRGLRTATGGVEAFPGKHSWQTCRRMSKEARHTGQSRGRWIVARRKRGTPCLPGSCKACYFILEDFNDYFLRSSLYNVYILSPWRFVAALAAHQLMAAVISFPEPIPAAVRGWAGSGRERGGPGCR